MAQSVVTVTTPNPTPPTNMSFTGTTGPNPPNLTKATYADWADNTKFDSAPPPYFDDMAAGAAVANAVTAFAAQTAALAGGTGATSGGTENSYPGTDTAPFDTPNRVGAVPASTSAAAEGTGIETPATQTYAAGVLVPGVGTTYLPAAAAWAAGDPGGPLRTSGVSPALTPGTMPNPNATHASSLSPAPATIGSFSPANTASGGGTFALQVNGTNFTPQSVVYINDVAMVTTYVSSIRLDVAAAIKRPSAGTYPVRVVTAGAVTTAATNYTYT